MDENTKGGTIDLRLRGQSGPQGTLNVQPDRLPRGRLKKDVLVPDKQQSNATTTKVAPQVVIKPFKPPPGVIQFNENDSVIPDPIPEKGTPRS